MESKTGSLHYGKNISLLFALDERKAVSLARENWSNFRFDLWSVQPQVPRFFRGEQIRGMSDTYTFESSVETV